MKNDSVTESFLYCNFEARAECYQEYLLQQLVLLRLVLVLLGLDTIGISRNSGITYPEIATGSVLLRWFMLGLMNAL